MLLVCSKEEYRKTPWVENEINRFCKFCEKRGKNPFDRIIVVYKDTVIELEDDLDGKYEEWDRAEPVKEILQGVANAVKNAGEYVESGLKYCPICGKSYLLDAMFCNSAKCPAPGTTLVDALEWANRKSDRDKDALELEREKNEAQKREIEKLRQRIAILEEQFASTKFCLFCGQENPKHAKVCMECGGRTFSETRQPVSQSAPEPKPQQKPAPQPAPEITPTLDDKPEFQIEGTILKRYIGKAAKVQIPLGVTSIGDKAFLDCGWLKQVVIPDSVNSIGKRAFFGCNGLEYIEVAKGNAVYRSENNCLIKRRSKTLILGCNTSVIPLGVTTIGQDAFRGCSGLAGIVIPEGITSIGGDAFRGCSGLTGIVIPESVTLIGKRAFFECNGLDYIEVAKGNAVYRSENDCLIEKRSKALILGCRNSMIPDSVVSIGEYAFYGYSDLTSITIPDSVTSIGTQAFWGCNSLTIYCEAPEEPSCWGKAWNVKNREANGNCPVVWGSPRPGFWRQRGSKLRGNMQKPIPKPSDSAPQKKSANQHGFGKLKAEKRFEIKKLCKPFYPLHNDYDKKWHYLRGRRER